MDECRPSTPCHRDGCMFCDPAGWLAGAKDEGSRILDTWRPAASPGDTFEYGDLMALLSGAAPPVVEPVLLRRADGRPLLYEGKVNTLFGDSESGKTWVALAGCAEVLGGGGKATFVDLDHNGMVEIANRLLLLGAPRSALMDLDRFRYAEPHDAVELDWFIADLCKWAPNLAVIDSVGEVLPMLNLSSNSPDDYTKANRRVITPLSDFGAAVLLIDHLPKDDTAREKGQTGTLAKKRAVNGVTLRVTVREQFAPGRGGSADLVVAKDRPGGLRAHCPPGRNAPAGRFILHEDGSWRITRPPDAPQEATAADRLRTVPAADLAELDGMVPGPRSKRDVEDRLGWGSNRAYYALKVWRDLRKHDL